MLAMEFRYRSCPGPRRRCATAARSDAVTTSRKHDRHHRNPLLASPGLCGEVGDVEAVSAEFDQVGHGEFADRSRVEEGSPRRFVSQVGGRVLLQQAQEHLGDDAATDLAEVVSAGLDARLP